MTEVVIKMKYVSTTEISKKWNISARRIGTLCAEGRIPNVQRAGNMWPWRCKKTANTRIKKQEIFKAYQRF